MPERSVLVIGVGNRVRGDDGASGEVVQRLRERGAQVRISVSEQLYGPTDLLEAWQGEDTVVLIDTMHSGEPPGTIRRFDASGAPLPARLRGSGSTDAFGLHEAIELGRADPAAPAVDRVCGRRPKVEAGAALLARVI